jgi:hypothetical protein
LEEEEVPMEAASKAAAEEGTPVELVQPASPAAVVVVRFQREPRSLAQPTPDRDISP